MFKKLALAGAMVAAIALVALAANAPTYTDVAGNLHDAQGVVLIDTTGQPYNASGGGGGGAVTIADGAHVTFGSKADAKSTATDTTAITAMQVWKQISASVQAFAAALPAGTNLIGKVGIDQTTDGTTNKVAATQTTASNLKMEPAGNVAAGATDSGNPLKVGGIFKSTPPTLTDGQRGDAQLDSNSNMRARIVGNSSGGADGVSNTLSYSTANTSASTAQLFTVAPFAFNGTTWDRAFTCTSQASATVTAAATTQIVALSGSTNIRVCSYQVGIATTGTFKFVSGTGTNCATGTADITPATNLIAGNVVAISAGNNAIFRAGASNALCLAAVTGNVQVFVSYAQF